MMYLHTKIGYKRWSGSEDSVWTKPCFEPQGRRFRNVHYYYYKARAHTTDGHMDTVIPPPAPTNVFLRGGFQGGGGGITKPGRCLTSHHTSGNCYETAKRHAVMVQWIAEHCFDRICFTVSCQPCWISHDIRLSTRFWLWQTPEIESAHPVPLGNVLWLLLPPNAWGCLTFRNLA